MRMVDMILKKKAGRELSKEEIEYVVNGYTDGSIPDYQMSAFLMAVCLNQMTYDETLNMTLAMADSGDRLDLSAIHGIKVDKHSTGGVGDKTSLVLAPMVAACNAKVAKMSGRGLGHTGGTIDKLEAFPGFSTMLSEKDFISQVNDIGLAITAQTGNLVPADKKIYALRDVTGTVDSIPLIASSIMSKKIASGADAIVLDVKTGSGAFMKSEEEAGLLAQEMVHIGKRAGRNTIAVITDMDQPLGMAVGNALEVIEAIDTLKGNGPSDLTELCLTLGTYMLFHAGLGYSEESAHAALENSIKSGAALDKFAAFVEAQGGDKQAVYDTSHLKIAENIAEVKAKQDGYVKAIESSQIGRASMILGGGRAKKGDPIDLSVGILLCKKTGDRVQAGDTIAKIYGSSTEKLRDAVHVVQHAYTYSEKKTERSRLIKSVVK